MRSKKVVYTSYTLLFFVGSIFLLVIEKLFNVGITYPNWSYWMILAWAFLFILHFVNVFITKRFMNKQWEREEIDKLVAKQKRRIDELQKKVEEQYKAEELPSGENTISE